MIDRKILNDEVAKFKIEHPEVSLETLCIKNGFSHAYIAGAVSLSKSNTEMAEEDVEINVRGLLEEGRKRPEKYLKKKSGKTRAVYALYKGDNILIVGSVEELAQFKGVKPQSIRKIATPSYRKSIKDVRGIDLEFAVKVD